MSTVWKIVISVMATLAVAGGGTYYYMNQKLENERSGLQSQVTDLNEQVEQLRLEIANMSPVQDTDEGESADANSSINTSWKDYKNNKYDFSLTFTDKWSGYQVEDWNETHSEGPAPATDFYTVYVPTSNSSFSSEKPGYAATFKIMVYPKDTYESLLSAGNVVAKNKLAENSSYVFVVAYWQDSPSDLRASGLAFEIESVAKTFKLIN